MIVIINLLQATNVDELEVIIQINFIQPTDYQLLIKPIFPSHNHKNQSVNQLTAEKNTVDNGGHIDLSN